MKAHKALRAILFVFILLLGLLLPTLASNPVLAESSSGQTTLFFTDALNNENITDYGFIPLSLKAPIKQNDSKYPPRLSSGEQWITWFSYAFISTLFEDFNDINFSEFGYFGNFGDFAILFPHPYRIVEGYTYNGNDTIIIQGDFVYNLYFETPKAVQKSGDNLTVGFYSLNLIGFPKLIKNTTIELSPEIRNGIYSQEIILEDINYTVKPGESLLFTVEIMPCNKTLSEYITNLLGFDRLEKLANWFENIPKLQDIGTTIKDFISVLEEYNITEEDFTEIINSMISSSFVYDSTNHPSSITIPAKISEEDIRVYYLRSIPEMNENRPETNNNGSIELTVTPARWSTEPFEQSKILKIDDTTVNLYFNYYQLINLIKGKITVITTLYDDNTTIASDEIELDRLKIKEIFNTPNKPITFSFSGSDTEISYGHRLSIGISLKNGTSAIIKLLYNSIESPSALRVKLEETQNIKIADISSNPLNKKIIPGGTIEYFLNVTSEKVDTLQINYVEREKVGEWEVISPESTAVTSNSITNVHVLIKSLNNLKESYGSSITLAIIVSGNTGIARQEVYAEISQDAIEYDVEIASYSNSINISKGENRTFFFIIKNNNTGALDDVDNYTISATSQNHWPLIPKESIRDLRIGDSTDPDDARVVIQVPNNTSLNSDVITITVTSDGNPSASVSINVTVHVIGGDILEGMYSWFDGVAEGLGLNDLFGSYGAIVLASIIMVIILFLLIILALVFTIKDVRIICTDRIKEIEVAKQAIFALTLQNPIKKTQTYEISAEQTGSSVKWLITVEPPVITIADRQSKKVRVIATPSESTELKDWTQITVHVKKTGRKKTTSINLVTMIKEGKTLLKLDNVTHWPSVFNPGEKVTTFCSVSNDGTVTARNVKVFFYLNGKQKNRVEVTIPAGNIADLQIPWIAVNGKNRIRIRLKE